ncbi:hypothetical protein [Mariniphaga sediminis]|uniref:hypothetical protein n=1 Tax=Mariniphaga sediminis TaxID=1628158 RepID=UPI0011C490B5|nr:hypothetical protein [Mariniphaga sediminis]
MFFKLLIISVILVAIVMLALGIKLLFNKNAQFTAHSCAIEDGSPDREGTCSKCELTDIVDCPENAESK